MKYMSVGNLLTWASGLPLWQRDALRRIAQQTSLADDDIREILQSLYIANGLLDGDTSALHPLTQDDLPIEKALGPRTLLCSIADVRNVNRLVEGQTLRFALDGITLIYGDNGSGKSGYCRIAKKLCRARAVDPILGNVFEDTSQPAKAKVKFQIGDSDPQEADWEDGQPAPEETSQISVFDARSAALYVDEKNQIEFLPPIITLVRELGQLCIRIAQFVNEDVDKLDQRLDTDMPQFPRGTDVAATIDRISRNTSIQDLPTDYEIRTQAAWGDAEGQELKELELTLANDPRSLTEQRERCRKACKALDSELKSLEAEVGELRVADLKAKHSTLVEARRLVDIAASKLPREPLGEIGSDPWRKLFQYAKEYSTLVYPEVPPPATRVGDRCVLCQQTLSPEASERLRRFEEFVSGEASREAEEAQQAYNQLVAAIEGTVIPSPDSVKQRLDEYSTISRARKACADTAAEFVAVLMRRRVALLKGTQNGEFDSVRRIPLPARPPLANEALALGQEAASFRGAATDTTERDRTIARRDELLARRQLSAMVELVLERRKDVETWHKLKACQAALGTQAISRKITEFRRDLITSELEARIKTELQNLSLDYIPFRIRDQSDRADSFVQVSLDAATHVVNSHILSEGEQRALALACFLADIAGLPTQGGIIVDDPVSSLDHLRMRTVAKRLVKEAAKRQVIVFTHSLPFFREVQDMAAESQVPIATHWVQRDGAAGFGTISENEEPWFAKAVKHRLHVLKRKQTYLAAAKRQSDESYRVALKDLFSDLRETWERLVEELLLYGVVERLRVDVKTQKLKGVYVDDGDHRTVYWQMKRASELSGHDMAASRNVVLPELEDVEEHIQTLEQYINEVNARKNEIQKRRESLERAPQASLM